MMAIKGLLREPLVHFLVLGALLFAIDQVIASNAEDPSTIVVGAAVDDEARGVFAAARGRDPSEAEIEALRQVWLDNEVLYREGLALQVDKGDSAIRDRVIFKALSVIDASISYPPIDDDGLRAWFENNREKYDEPVRYNFQEAVLVGEATEEAARRLADTLNGGAGGEVEAGLRVYKDRPHANLVQSFGEDFPNALAEMAVGEWRAVATREGWRAIWLESITPAQPAVYEPLRNIVLQDWRDAEASEQRTAAVRALAKKYTVVIDPAT